MSGTGDTHAAALVDDPPLWVTLLSYLGIALCFCGLFGLSRPHSTPIYGPAHVLLLPGGVALLPRAFWLLQFGTADKPAEWSYPPRGLGAAWLSAAIAAIGRGVPRDHAATLAQRLTEAPIGITAAGFLVWLLLSRAGRNRANRGIELYGAVVMLVISVVIVTGLYR